MTVYMSGTRSLEEMIIDIRNLCYQENYSLTEGWDDNVIVEIANLALNRIYAAVTQVDNPAYIQEATMDVFAQQTDYPLPIDVHMSIRLDDVRYLYGTNAWEFITLRQGTIADRFSYPTNIPDTFCIRNGTIVLSPAPNVTKLGALIINYQKRMRKMDIRRGIVSSYTAPSLPSQPNYIFNITFLTPSQKDLNMQANANSLLDKINYCCIVDNFGTPIMNAIPLQNYNSFTQQLFADPSFIPNPLELAALNAALAVNAKLYIVQGDYSSTHSELDRQYEDSFIEYCVLRLLRLSSNVEATPIQMQAEQTVLDRLLDQSRRYRPSVYPIQWQERMRPRSWPWGRRGMY